MVLREPFNPGMPGSMEGLVRPFWKKAPSPDAAGAGEPVEVPDAYITWSSRVSPSVTTLEGQGINWSWEADEGGDNDDEEVTRETHTVRVENPTDPEQYVDVEVVDAVVFKNPTTGRKRRMTLSN